jgi:hypothetical protein
MGLGSLQQAHHPQLLAGKNCTILLPRTGISNIRALSQCRYPSTNQDGIISHNFSVVYSVFSQALCPGYHDAVLSLSSFEASVFR